jgi:hypothetical protein
MIEDDPLDWTQVLELYHHDRVVEAWELAQREGIGADAGYLSWYRLIEAEAITRAKGKIVQLRDWLRLEVVPSDIGILEPDIVRAVEETCDHIAQELEWEHGAPTMVSILAAECDAPWATNPFGYCADKYDFDKICLPDYLVDDDAELRQAVAHEYAHVISLNLSLGHAPRWLEEAISVLTEGELDPEVLDRFRTVPEAWLSPGDLETAFSRTEEEDGDTGTAADEVWCAYQQAGVIGHYLKAQGGAGSLGKMLRLHADEHLWRNLWHTVIGRTRTDFALEKCYGFDTRALFQAARQSLFVGE